MEAHPFVCPASRCTYGFTGHVAKVYVSDANQIMVAYWSVYGDFSPTLYMILQKYTSKARKVFKMRILYGENLTLVLWELW
jgi:hypothetical protein